MDTIKNCLHSAPYAKWSSSAFDLHKRKRHSTMEDLTGKQLGKYQIVAPLGEGGMAAVYKAYQAGIDRFVALKILPRHFASDPEFVGRFEQEARVIAKLQHVYILPVHDYGEDDGYTYIVMPFVERGTLNDRLDDKPLPLLEIRRIISQVGDALHYAHSRGLVHRDIKPSNVLIDEQGNCLLTDFGISKMVGGTAKFTQTGAIIGTPEYMSPEQILGEELDGRSDIYSLGVVLYQLATGRAPYRAETPPAVFVKHLHDPLPPPSTYNSNIPPALEKVILKALARDREDRYKTAKDMVQALQSAIPLDMPAETVKEEVDASSFPTVLESVESVAEVAPPTPVTPAAQTPMAEAPARRKLPSWVLGFGGLAIGVVCIGIVVLGAIFGPKLLSPDETEEPVATEGIVVPPVATDQPTEIVVPSEAPTEEEVSEGVSVKWTYTVLGSIWSMDTYGDGMATGDLDGDGIPDVAFGTKNGYVIALNGTNGQELWTFRITSEEASEPISADVVDVNDDGSLEIVAAGKGDASNDWRGIVYVLNRDGEEMWVARSSYNEVVDLAYGDIDGDGDMDVVASAGTYPWGGGEVILLDGATGSKIWAQSLGGGHGRGIDAWDADGDGDVEIAVENYDNKVFLIDGKTGDVLWSRSKPWYGRDVVIGDVDSDGIYEVVSGAGQVVVFDPVGNQEWTAPKEDEGMNISVRDITGDGLNEVIFSSGFAGMSYVLDGTGATLWERERSGVHAIGDVNGDGVNDVVFATIRYWGIEAPFSIDAVDGSSNELWSYPLDAIFNEGGFSLATANLDDDSAYEVLVANGTQLFVLDAGG
jgi:outer membrane protein assembly factor BamB